MRTLLRSLWEWWKPVARKIGDFQARVILLLFYFVILGPFALALRLSSDPLSMRPGAPRGWRPRAIPEGAHAERATKQF